MKRAFTMIELLVVMAIMGILTIITVSQFTTARIKARDAQRKADLSSVSKALLMYYADYSVFPASNASGQIVVKGTPIDWGGEFTDGTTDPGGLYMKVLPKENTNESTCPYYYVSNGANEFAVLGCLENKDDSDGKKKDKSVRNITCSVGGVGSTGYNFGFVSPNISLDSDAGGCSL